MPAPIDFAGSSGVARVYARRFGNDYSVSFPYETAMEWIARSVELGSRDRLSTATIAINRDLVLRGQITDPVIFSDAVFAVGYKDDQDSGSGPGTLLFEGVPQLLERRITHQEDAGDIQLHHSINLWADAGDSQVIGQYASRINSTPSSGFLINEGDVPCVFNPGGLPNRSIFTAKRTLGAGGVLAFSTGAQFETFYFVSPSGHDIYYRPSAARLESLKARYWTYAQAIGYMLMMVCGAKTAAAVTRNGVTVDFGEPDPDATAIFGDKLWGVISPYLLAEPVSESYEAEGGPIDPAQFAFDPTPSRRLRAKANNLSIEGMNAIEALALLLHASGLGWWIDSFYQSGSIDTIPSPYTHSFKVFSAGGHAIAGGVGGLFVPRLQEYGSSIAGQTAGQVLSVNTVASMDASWDYAHIISRPAIVRAPTLYEITINLRPGWRPVHGQNSFFFDKVDPIQNVTDPGPNSPTINELLLAIAEGRGAFDHWSNDLATILEGDWPDGTLGRQARMANVLHAKGNLASQFYETGRKWVAPTDWTYPTEIFKRVVSGINLPDHWEDYSPVDFSIANRDANGIVINPLVENALEYPIPDTPDPFNPGFFLPGPETWAQRRRPLSPCLVTDAAERSIGVKVELNFRGLETDYAEQWVEWSSFQVLPDELGIMLTYDNPFDVVNPNLNPTVEGSIKWANLFMAYIHHQFRVRVTATIEAGDSPVLRPPAPTSVGLPRERVFIRRDKYRKAAVASQHFNRWVRKREDLVIVETPATNDTKLDAAAAKWFLFRPVDDMAAALEESVRIQSLGSVLKSSSKFTIPWVEIGARPGLTVHRLEETGGAGTIPRRVDFRTIMDNGMELAPHIAGVIVHLGQGGHRTTVLLEDWRALQELGPV